MCRLKSEISKIKIAHIWFDAEKIYVRLLNGKKLSSSLKKFPRLNNANESQRKNWRLIGKGIGVHWVELDEDISVNTLIKLRTRKSGHISWKKKIPKKE
jgi:hypothetical protein